jgi:tungstate transport system substrate-binding protein
MLLNIYHVIVVNPTKCEKINLPGAQAFAQFLISSDGQKMIGEFGVDEYGQPLFIPDAGKTEAELGLK